MVSVAALAGQEKLRITELRGDGHREVTEVGPLGQAGAAMLTFAREKVAPESLQARQAQLAGAALICTVETADAIDLPDTVLLLSENPRLSFMRAVAMYFPPVAPAAGVHPTAVIDPSAKVDPSASIGAYCVIGAECEVGAGTRLYSHVTLYSRVRIGRNVSVNAGTVIGADGFGYERNEDGELEKFPHIGGVVIEDDVEIGSNTSIDRGTLGDTRIRTGARIDNQVHVAHNVDIGERAAVIAQAMLGGSAKIGAEAWIAPSAVIMNQIAIGANATVGLGAVVVKQVAQGEVVMGAPAANEAEFKATRAAIRKLTNG